MFESIYCSIGKGDLLAEDILNILEKSREFNSKNDITGCLLYHDDEFIQILEGEKELIKILFSKIEKDNRHTQVMLLAENEKEERIFKRWSMAFHELDNNDVNNLNKLLFINNFISISELTERPTLAVRIFWYMAKQLLEK